MSLKRFDQLLGELRLTLAGLPDKRTGANTQTLFQIDDFPTDNHIRDLLDPVEPVEPGLSPLATIRFHPRKTVGSG